MRSFNAPPVSEKLTGEFENIKNWLTKSNLPLYLEVGCGVGFHPIQFAKNNPQSRLLAFERTTEKFLKAEKRFKNNGAPENLLIVHGDASFFIGDIFLKTQQPLKGVFFFYPNPYPKKSQSNLRLAHMPLTLALTQALGPEGILLLASNKPEYIDEAKNLIPERTSLQLLSSRKIPANEIPRTHFEKKYLSRGEPCQELIFIKK